MVDGVNSMKRPCGVGDDIGPDATLDVGWVHGCRYQWRPSIPIAEIERVIGHVRGRWGGEREVVVFVDNCYGEFVEDREPTHVGADIVAGSLIKVRGGLSLGDGPVGGEGCIALRRG
jgi:cystathionine beta-lyase family protein involved in aluminum resistance